MKKVILDLVRDNKQKTIVIMLFSVMLAGLNYSYFEPVKQTNSNEILKRENSQKANPEALLLKAKNLRENAKIVAKVIGLPRDTKSSYAGLSKTQALVALEIKNHFKGNLYKKAIVVAWCESRLDPNATNKNRNGTTDRGVFQINDGGTMQRLGINAKEAFNYSHNIRAAKVLFDDRGWQPWVCSKQIKRLN